MEGDNSDGRKIYQQILGDIYCDFDDCPFHNSFSPASSKIWAGKGSPLVMSPAHSYGTELYPGLVDFLHVVKTKKRG